MNFLYPLFLAGIAAVGLPIVLHMIRRHTRKRVTFSSLMFLRTTVPRFKNRSRLENLPLLILRCIILCLLAFAFARPFFPRETADNPVRLGSRIVVLLDTSASMRRAGMWAQAVGEARSVLEGVSRADRVCVMSFDENAQTLIGFEQWGTLGPAQRVSTVTQHVSKLSPGWALTNLGQALVSAAEAIEDDEVNDGQQSIGTRRIVLISDLQRGSNLEALRAYEWPRDVELVVKPILCRGSTNAALQLVTNRNLPARPDSDEPPQIRITNSPDATEERFGLSWADADPEAASSPAADVYVPAGHSAVVPAPAREDGATSGKLVLTGDDHDFDNALYMAPHLKQQANILYIGSDDADDRKGMLYYLRLAFAATRSLDPQVICRPADGIADTDMATANLIIVADSIEPERLVSLRTHLESGGTILLVTKMRQRRALKLDPKYLPAKIQLAQDLLRLGDEQEGWTLANEVHASDAYNVEAYNLTSLHDNLSKFKTLRADGFIIRMDELEAAVYGDEVVELLQQAKSQLCRKYDLELDRPVTVELFPNQQDFAVRTFGMPGGDGFLGVCFGNVVTANSPKANRPSNWKSLLWHEFCHVVTLNLTHNKMPRWLSEGISVYEELQRDPTWGQRMSPQYRSMILAGELTPVSDLSAAFLDPSGAENLQFAYYESALVVEFLVERFGLATLKAVLGDLEKGDQINIAISRRAAPMKQIEKQFKVFARKRAKDLAPDADWGQPKTERRDPADRKTPAELLAQHPNNFQALTMYAKTLLADRKWEEAKEPLEKLIALYPQYAGDDNAYRLLAEAHQNLDETEQERGVLDKLAMISSDATYAYERLMEIAAEKKDWPEVVENGEKYMAVVPLLAGLHRRLGLAYEELGRAEQAIRSYRRLLLLDPADPADVNYRIGRLLERTDRAAAKRYVLLALAEAPRFRQAHRLLLKIINADRERREPGSPAVQEDVP